MVDFLLDRVKSFRHAFAGIRDIVITEHNARVHFFFTVLVLGLCGWLGVGDVRLALIIIVVTLVWIAEAFNTVLELVIDIVSPQYTVLAKRAKDIAAAAVLFASIGALVTGIVLLGPLIIAKF